MDNHFLELPEGALVDVIRGALTFENTSVEELDNYAQVAHQKRDGVATDTSLPPAEKEKARKAYTALLRYLNEKSEEVQAQAARKPALQPQVTSDQQSDIEVFTNVVRANFTANPDLSVDIDILLSKISGEMAPFFMKVMNDNDLDVSWNEIMFGHENATSGVLRSPQGIPPHDRAALSETIRQHFPVKFDADIVKEFRKAFNKPGVQAGLSGSWKGNSGDLQSAVLLSTYRAWVEQDSKDLLNKLDGNKPGWSVDDRNYFWKRAAIEQALLAVLDEKIAAKGLKTATPLPAMETLSLSATARPQQMPVLTADQRTEEQKKLVNIMFLPAVQEKGKALSQDIGQVLEAVGNQIRGEIFKQQDYGFGTLGIKNDLQAAIKRADFLENGLEQLKASFASTFASLSPDLQQEGEKRWIQCFEGKKALLIQSAFDQRAQFPELFKSVKEKYKMDEAILISFVCEIATQYKKAYSETIVKPGNKQVAPDMAEQIAFYDALIPLLDEKLKNLFTGPILP